MRRRSVTGALACGAAWLAAGCAGDPAGTAAGAARAPRFASPWRTVQGGFLAPVVPALGVQARPGTGAFVTLQSPTAVALRGHELLVADQARSRLWRIDLAFNTLTPLPAAPVAPGVALALGIDYSAWVLDPAARQVLRFARDGGLMQTWRTRVAAPSPASITLVDGGIALLVADTSLGQWAELRGAGAVALPVRPHRGDGVVAARVDALAAGPQSLFVLDRLAAAVHRVARDGRILATMTHAALADGAGLAVDRWDRVFVADGQGRHVLVLHAGSEPRLLTAAELGVQRVGGVAVDERLLAVADRLVGQVQVLMLEGAPK